MRERERARWSIRARGIIVTEYTICNLLFEVENDRVSTIKASNGNEAERESRSPPAMGWLWNG